MLDALLKDDPYSRVAVETFAITGQIHIAGEVTTKTYVDIPKIAREVVREVGYTRSAIGFDAETCGVNISIDEQSPDIALGVDTSLEARAGEDDEFERIGAGDQGMMFGYACRETEELMPLPIVLAHNLTRHLAAVRKNESIPYLRPDGKSQVTVEYDGDRPVRVDTVVVSTQHDPEIPLEEIRREITERVVNHVIPASMHDDATRVYVNPTGRFVIGGPKGDAGLTGRKIIADTYGGMARHGGGAFSGKDPTKVDRSAAYAARWVAKNVVAAGLADRCEVQVAYAIGVAHPVSVAVETFGTGRLPAEKIAQAVSEVFDLRPAAIIHYLNLRRPIYRQTASTATSAGRISICHGNASIVSTRCVRQPPSPGSNFVYRTSFVKAAALAFAACFAFGRSDATSFLPSHTYRAGTRIACVLEERLDSSRLSYGHAFRLRVVDASLPALHGAVVIGYITEVHRPAGGNQGRVGFFLTTIELRNGEKKPISAYIVNRGVVRYNPAAQYQQRQQLSPMAGVPYGTITPGPIAWQMNVGNGPSSARESSSTTVGGYVYGMRWPIVAAAGTAVTVELAHNLTIP